VKGKLGMIRETGKSRRDLIVQIAPPWIPLLDELDLPRSAPLLELLLTLNRTDRIPVHLEVHKPINAVAGAKPSNGFGLVLPRRCTRADVTPM
jgi:hypothetical protein